MGKSGGTWRPTWQKVLLAVLLAALAAEAILIVSDLGTDQELANTTSDTTSPETTLLLGTSPAATTVASSASEPDAVCRTAFNTAVAAGTEATRFATLAACTEDEWLRVQSLTPLDGATLAGLCNARYGLPALSCGTADAERVARERAEANRTTDPPVTVTVPQATAPPPIAPPPIDNPNQQVMYLEYESGAPTAASVTTPFTVTGNWTVYFTPTFFYAGAAPLCALAGTVRLPDGSVAPLDQFQTIDPFGGRKVYNLSGTFTIAATTKCVGNSDTRAGWTIKVTD